MHKSLWGLLSDVIIKKYDGQIAEHGMTIPRKVNIKLRTFKQYVVNQRRS